MRKLVRVIKCNYNSNWFSINAHTDAYANTYTYPYTHTNTDAYSYTISFSMFRIHVCNGTW